MIVWCCGMSRSGGTVQYQITADLVWEAGLGDGVGHVWAPYTRKAPARWVVIKREQSTPERMFRCATDPERSRVIGIHRDPRAVAASLYLWRTDPRNPDPGEPDLWDVWVELELTLRWYRQWEPHMVYQVPYQQAITSWGMIACEINEVLRLGLSPEVCYRVADRWSVVQNRNRMGSQRNWLDGVTLLTQAHITGGGIRWEQILPRCLIGKIEHDYGEWMEAHGYNCFLGGTPTALCGGGQGIGFKFGEAPCVGTGVVYS